MPTSKLTLINKSTHADAKQYLDPIAEAIDSQLGTLALAWGSVVWDIVDAVADDGFQIVLADDDKQVQGALGYHDVSPDGKPYALILLDEILNNGGTWTSGANSVSCCVSHEVCELIGDPGANRWATAADGKTWALELCDAVEADTYEAPNGVALSNFLLPDYFNALAPTGSFFDHLALVTKPFELRPGGYAIPITGQPVWGDNYPEFRKARKMRPGSRTHARLEWLGSSGVSATS